jgi:tRNA threonylcarbamoyladenosine biosynthesis protein TsaB
MLVAALDTATLTLSCALVDVAPGAPPRLRASRNDPAPARGAPGATGGHGGRLPGVLVELLEAEGLQIADVEGYAIGIGPGSFTGLRIGLATWKGLAYANRRPIAGASSLAAMAVAAAPGAPDGAVLIPLLDAKKGELYTGFFRVVAGGVEAVAPEAVLGPEALLARAAELSGAMAFGDGLAAYADRLASLPRLGVDVQSPPALAIAALAAPRLTGAAFDPQALFALEPHYVRPSEAELKFPKGLGPGADRT